MHLALGCSKLLSEGLRIDFGSGSAAAPKFGRRRARENLPGKGEETLEEGGCSGMREARDAEERASLLGCWSRPKSG